MKRQLFNMVVSFFGNSGETKNKNIIRQVVFIFSLFSMLTFITGILSYYSAAQILKKQLALKCSALASTVASVISSDSNGYETFLHTLDTESDYYKRTKELMMNIKRANADHVTYIYTEARVGNDTMMYVIGGEDPSSPVYTAPGVIDTLVYVNRKAYDKQSINIGNTFENTLYGTRLSAYVPIIHKDSGVFLGLVGVDITKIQYNNIMNIFLFQTIACFVTGFILFCFALRLISGNLHRTIKIDANKAKNDFLSNMSHEYFTPLNVVLGMGELIRMTDNLNQAKDYADEIIKAGKDLHIMVKNVLEYVHNQKTNT